MNFCQFMNLEDLPVQLYDKLEYIFQCKFFTSVGNSVQVRELSTVMTVVDIHCKLMNFVDLPMQVHEFCTSSRASS